MPTETKELFKDALERGRRLLADDEGRSEDQNTIIEALKCLGVHIEIRPWPKSDGQNAETVEVFARRKDQVEQSAGGFKFTFKDGKLVQIHARNLQRRVDDWWACQFAPKA